jgi:hypothetical protein
MIAIVNIGPHDQDPLGEKTYEVRINAQVITTFKHKRRDSLSKCLLAASKAVEEQQIAEIKRILERLYSPPIPKPIVSPHSSIKTPPRSNTAKRKPCQKNQ